jgi:PAS domain S-box-containing protein
LRLYHRLVENENSPSDALFRLMVDRVQDYAIFVLDRGGNITSWNTGAARIKQYAADEIIGKHFSVFYTPEDVARNWPEQELETALREGRFEDEGWRVRKDGSRFWANVIITALRDDKGALLGFSKITRDVTERRRQDEALRQSEERFRLLVDSVQDYAIYLLSPEGVVSSWNAGARRIKGYTAQEIVGRHFSAFYEAEDVAAGKPWAELAMAREHGRAEDEGWRVRKNGTRFWARVVVTPLHGIAGELRGYAKVTQDLTQRRHSEALEDSARRINDFIAVLAHELRNPLAPIRNAVAVLEKVKPGDAAFEQMRRTIDRQSAQMARIVDDLLDISRITRGTLAMQHAQLDAGELIARAVEAARPGIEAARHALVLDIPAGVHLIEGDASRLSQALTNLLNNAARYTDPGGRITVSLRRAGSPPMVEIRVADTGQGIDPQMLGSIFGMFVQGRSVASRPQTGLGVGLALARSIVELHHGTVEASSEGLGKGSEFIMRLPASDAKEKQAPAAPAAQPAPAKPPSKRLLVVDDNADAASMLSELLRALGNEVKTVNGGTEALQVVEEFRPDIILLDIGMPGMSGFEVARRLRARKRSPEPLIVAVTGWGKLEDEIRGREAGFDMHLVKPLETEQLHRLLERASATRH